MTRRHGRVSQPNQRVYSDIRIRRSWQSLKNPAAQVNIAVMLVQAEIGRDGDAENTHVLAGNDGVFSKTDLDRSHPA